MPPLTKPTVITVVADELCTIAVATVPSRSAFHLLLVDFSSVRSKTPPDIFSSEVLIKCMPYKNSANPPNIDSKSKIVILFLLIHLRHNFSTINILAECVVKRNGL